MYDSEDPGLIESTPLKFSEFEFENYTLGNDILRDLILDEVIMSNSRDARRYYRAVQQTNPDGILEMMYDKQDANQDDK